jgi:hypothetical protein
MVARMRTDVLKREEKGIGPVSFPRILLAGLGGTFATLALGGLLGFVPSCMTGVFVTVAVVLLTQPISGTPMAQFLIKAFQGLLVVRSMRNREEDEDAPPVLADHLMQVMNIDPDSGALECDEVFNVTEEVENADELPELVFFRDITDLDSKGLQVIDNPFNQS